MKSEAADFCNAGAPEDGAFVADAFHKTVTPVLEILRVGKAFGKRQALEKVDFSIGTGEIVAIVGRSGSGKSTLLRLIAGLDRPTAGKIYANGVALTSINGGARLMFQDACLLPWRTVLQNVALGSIDHNLETARSALVEVGLPDRAGDWPANLSGGQRQRVALARALASGAPLLLFDEPLGALDALTRLEMQQLIERVWRKKSNISMLLITHDAEEAIALADRVLIMDSGKLVFESEVSMDRPRNRSDHDFIRLKDKVLNQILGRH